MFGVLARVPPDGRVFACLTVWQYVYMPDMASERESVQRRRRALHEQLRALTHESLMRGSIVERWRTCGKSNCACATDRGARHRGKVLAVFLNGRTQSLALREADEERVRAAIDAYDRAWRVISALTECELADLRRQARERRRSSRKRR